MLLVAISVNLAITYILGAWQESSLLFGLTWMYKDRQGGESVTRLNFIINTTAGLYDVDSIRMAYGTGTTWYENDIHLF